MVWVKSEYAGELAVVSAWLSALLPWYVSYVPRGPVGSSVLYIRWPFLQVRYFLGVSFGENLDTHTLTSPWFARTIGFGGVEPAYDVWMAGAAVVSVGLLLSVAMYHDLDAVEDRLPVSPVRLVGAVLAVAGSILLVAAIQFYRLSPATEYPIPVGAAIVLILGGSLLRVDLVEGRQAEDAPAEDPA